MNFTKTIFESSVSMPIIVFLVCILIPVFLIYHIVNYVLFRERAEHYNILFKERAEHYNTRQRLAAAEGQRKELDFLRFTDVVTRIPNQSQWEEDLKSIQTELDGGEQFHSILIDLDGFKSINDKCGFERGDAVILCFAQTLYETMRRNEKIYKRPLKDIDPRELWTRIYRKYAGGDEFIFLIRGPEDEALGFLIRVHKMTVSSIKSEVKKLLGTTVTVDFHGAVCPIFPKDDAATAIARLRAAYGVVKKRGINRIYWYSEIKSKDIDEIKDRRLHRVYEDAEAEFALPSSGLTETR